MTHAELRTALAIALPQLRGSTTLLTQLLNRSIRFIENLNDWPFMLTEPVSDVTEASQNSETVTSARSALDLTITGFSLIYLPIKVFNLLNPGADATANPLFWSWIKVPASNAIMIKWWPKATVTQTFQYKYYAYSAALSGDADTNWLTTNADGLIIAKSVISAQPFAKLDRDQFEGMMDIYKDELQGLYQLFGAEMPIKVTEEQRGQQQNG